jgi:plastocyanin
MKNKFFNLSLLGLALIFIVSGCGSTVNNKVNNIVPDTSLDASTTAQVSTPVVSPTTATISIKNFAFNPATITIKKGTTITWTNDDRAPHELKSSAFNSMVMSTGQSFSFVFNDSGTFDYSCSIHPSMTGKIIVE